MQPKWLDWVQRLQAIAQTGLTFAEDPYDIERYQQIRDLAIEIAAAHSDAEPELLLKLFTHDSGYTTPKIDVRGAVFRDDQLLLVRERSDGLWTLPGGWADVGDTPRGAIEREVFEESGYIAKVRKLAAVYDRNSHPHPPNPFSVYKLFFICECVGGEATISYETTEVAFFSEDALPPLSTARVLESQLKRLFEHYRNPDLPTDYD